MLRLIRGINLTVDPDQGHRLRFGSANSLNLSQHTLTLWVTLGGKFDHDSGFIVNVCEIDDAFEQALSREAVTAQTGCDIISWSREILQLHFPNQEIIELKLDLNERLSVFEKHEKQEMIQVTKKYEVAAAHRLHNKHWNSDKNMQVFGKCNNTEGHGHNYLLEVTLGGKPEAISGQLLDLDEIDRIVKVNILDRFDHKNLNTETVEFAQLNPTVENMCQVFWDILDGQFSRARLMKVGVWETPKTYAEYAGPLSGPLSMSDAI